ncbi:pantetheinase [Aplysia californica]|uniref:Pantetheinase n=1 Tax=Aplysia californica TaxID=6500 RepID=A0ABM0ZUT8_APLCA|nr:pantetheinase [Aplysia californica]
MKCIAGVVSQRDNQTTMLAVSGQMSRIGLGLLFLCCLFLSMGDTRSLQPSQKIDGLIYSASKTYRAAVYEHDVIVPAKTNTPVTRREALENMQKNLDVYKVQAEAANEKGAQILVFPEDGLYGYEFTRDTIYPYLEAIPDPDSVTWSPCSDPERFPETQVLRWLSCLAQNNSLYLVANMGDKVSCEPDIDSKCPSDKRYQYNTAVAFGPDGKLLAKYHKYNLFYESQFNKPKPEVKYFDTPFGRFGFLICFDILFEEPAVPMVTSHGIKNIVFPTAWMDALPLLSAIGYHSSFARGFRVNVLAANIHRPAYRFQGSGLYTPEGMKEFYYNRTNTPEPRLLVADLKVLSETPSNSTSEKRHNSVRDEKCIPREFIDELSIPPHFHSEQDEQRNQRLAKIDPQHHIARTKDFFVKTARTSVSELRAKPFNNKGYTFLPLDSVFPFATTCQGQVCCYLTYELTNKSSSELFVLGAFDGVFHGKYYFQTCAVLRCPTTNHSTCGSYTFDSDTGFRRLELTAEVQTPFVLPQAVLSDGGQLQLAPADQWGFHHRMTLKFEPGLTKPLIEAAIIGRDYERDL